MMKNILLSVLFFLSSSVFSAETLTIATYPIPLMVVSKDEGVFIELTKALAQEANVELNIVLLTPQRAFQELDTNNADGVFSELKSIMPEDYEVSDSVYVKRDYAFTVKGKPLLETIADLSGKRVAITSGYPYSEKLMADKSIQFVVTSRDEQNVKMLLAGRVDAFVVEEKSGLKAFSNNGRKNEISYNPAKPLSEQDVFFAFQKNISGKKFADKINTALQVLRYNGTFARIMAKAQ
jgi:polar amino acid transport system substrate-binding protein